MLVLLGGIGHVAWGLYVYRRQLSDTLHDGFVNAVLSHFERRAALWFILFGAHSHVVL